MKIGFLCILFLFAEKSFPISYFLLSINRYNCRAG